MILGLPGFYPWETRIAWREAYPDLLHSYCFVLIAFLGCFHIYLLSLLRFCSRTHLYDLSGVPKASVHCISFSRTLDPRLLFLFEPHSSSTVPFDIAVLVALLDYLYPTLVLA